MDEEPMPALVSPRQTRQKTRLAAAVAFVSPHSESNSQPMPAASASNTKAFMSETKIHSLPETLGASLKLKHLTRKNLQLLLKKRRLLQENQLEAPQDMQVKGLAQSLMATLLFAQEEAGTAVCISRDGILLTCSHCVAETADEFDKSKSHWLLFASGQVVEAKTLVWDSRRDLALLKVIAAQEPPSSTTSDPSRAAVGFPFITPATSPPPLKSRLVCVGHPGSNDLEAAETGIQTGYDMLHLSTGTFRGCVEGQDVQDNSDIGALMHTCWTYWGHSGAPLIERRTGRLVGLHSSWDDKTGMRRGIALEAIQGFLRENERHLVENL
ncbi:AT hook domain-containing protein [Colletotrichum truncatum]|uniref:AT hook domain-containing protein n=1 Tax=Colletotrichum truncatum TaxID=5467 RepID=A0ACC3YHP5_COLTU|nr:AT hook domain-containing protein [Colletotrichum truncatum]KAF6792941.1 AT hook domain-containing protein [Colletotrichum truncatum]